MEMPFSKVEKSLTDQPKGKFRIFFDRYSIKRVKNKSLKYFIDEFL